MLVIAKARLRPEVYKVCNLMGTLGTIGLKQNNLFFQK